MQGAASCRPVDGKGRELSPRGNPRGLTNPAHKPMLSIRILVVRCPVDLSPVLAEWIIQLSLATSAISFQNKQIPTIVEKLDSSQTWPKAV